MGVESSYGETENKVQSLDLAELLPTISRALDGYKYLDWFTVFYVQ